MEVMQPLREKGGLHQVVSKQIFFLQTAGKGDKGDRRTRSCTLCVANSQHNASKEVSGRTFSESSCRKGDARTSCNIRDDGGSAEMST
jgi:hypothetical protein